MSDKRIRIRLIARESNDALRLLRRLATAMADTDADVDAEIDMAAPPEAVVPDDEQMETHLAEVASTRLDELARAAEEFRVQSLSRREIMLKTGAAHFATARARKRLAALGITIVTAIARVLSKSGS